MQLAPLYPLLYKILKPAFPSCLWTGSTHQPLIALTFDDGPHREYTPKLLKVLDRYQVQGNFFWLGNCVISSHQVAKEVYNRGHWIGLHGWQHHSFPALSSQQLQQSLWQTQAAIHQACQLSPEKIRDVRPPNGLFTPQTLRLLHQWHYRPVMWSVVPEDWLRPGVEIVKQRVLQQVQNGSLIVLHDGEWGGQDVAEIAEVLIRELLQRGYEFVTVDQLWRFKE